MHMFNFLCSDSLLYFFLFLSTLHSVYTRDCSCVNSCSRLHDNFKKHLQYTVYIYFQCKWTLLPYCDIFLHLKNILLSVSKFLVCNIHASIHTCYKHLLLNYIIYI